MKLSHLFLPHPETHQKAHLIKAPAIFVYILIFLVLHFSFSLLGHFKSDVLGIASKVDQQELIELTNKEREKYGLPPLKENEKLNKAALEKGKNMFEEDYWAHFSPSGKDPWSFITDSGYKFSFAGENLARNFYSSEEVIKAWMDSPTHKENIINNKYEEIGIAVLEGTLKGQKTILIVQEFGKPFDSLASIPNLDTRVANTKSENQSFSIAGESKQPFKIDPYLITKSLGLSVIGFLISLIVLDLYIIRRRAVARITARHLPHLAILTLSASALISISPGSII